MPNYYDEYDEAYFDDDYEDDQYACHSCSGTAQTGYDDCEFASLGVYEPGPGSREAIGCPRMTGTF